MGEMDLNTQNQNENPSQPVNEETPPVPASENPTQPTESVDQPVQEMPQEQSEQTPVAEEPTFIPHGQIDPSFNCQPCQGEGLDPNTQLPCTNCDGTGKEKVA